MNISKRLKSISDLIDNNSNIVDIGCDHALLDIYLTIYKKCNCTALDVNETILKNAKKNIKKYDLQDKITVTVGNGFDNLNLNYNNTIILSGMGTSTIIKIIKKNKTKNIICQTNTNQYELRKTICNLGYYIVKENIIFENNKYYISIKFEKGNKKYNDKDYLLGPILRQENSETFISYKKNMYKKNYLGYLESLKFNKNNKKLHMMMEILKEEQLIEKM
ncbi:MAG: SAM-dependent methyltransferase [Bacilli bacterium]|nr:SAM-dependent methyltransferase [Bacilli bacterium]